MNKKIVYIGLVLLVISIVAFFGVSAIAVPLEGGAKAILMPKGSAYFNISINGTNYIHAFAFRSSSPVSFYYANRSAFDAIEAANSSNMSIASAAISLEGRGVLEAVSGAMAGIFPYTAYTSYLNMTKPFYFSQNAILPAGKYYAIFFNNGTSVANVTVIETALSESSAISSSILALVAIILFIAAIVVIVIGLIRKPKSTEAHSESEQDEAAEATYRRIEEKANKSKR